MKNINYEWHGSKLEHVLLKQYINVNGTAVEYVLLR